MNAQTGVLADTLPVIRLERKWFVLTH